MKHGCVVPIIVTGALLALYVESGRRMSAQRKIAHAVVDLIPACKAKEKHDGLGVIPLDGGIPQTSSDSGIYITGKVLVWDMSSDSRSPIHRKLPPYLRATHKDNPITVFMLIPQENRSVGRYSRSAQSAYISHTGVAVANWPEKKAIGYCSIPSAMPRSSRLVAERPEYGDRMTPIVSWIRARPRLGYPTMMQTTYHSTENCGDNPPPASREKQQKP